jgi:hypothetical protein
MECTKHITIKLSSYPINGRLLNMPNMPCAAFMNPSMNPVVVLMNTCIPFSSITITPPLVLPISRPPLLIIVAGSISGNLKFGICTLGKLGMSKKNGAASDIDTTRSNTKTATDNNEHCRLIENAILMITIIVLVLIWEGRAKSFLLITKIILCLR